MATHINLRRDTLANWTAEDPVLEQGEIALEYDNLTTPTAIKIKAGDGTRTYTALPYIGSGSGGALDDEAVYDLVADIIQGSASVTATKNDTTNKVTLTANVSVTEGIDPHQWIVITNPPYNCSPAASSLTNTNGMRAAMDDAIDQDKNVFIPGFGQSPGSTYLVRPKCLTPATLNQGGKGLMVLGEGGFRSVLQADRANWASGNYFYDNRGASPTNTLSMAEFRDFGLVGGPTDTPTQRIDVDMDVNGVIQQGYTDQSFRWQNVRFATMNTCYHTIATNNADVTTFINCRFMHILGNVLLLDNEQSVNFNFYDCPMDIIAGNVIHLINSDGLGGGGAIHINNSHIIIQRHDSYVGRLVKLDYQHTSTIGFHGVRVENRNDAMVIDGTANAGQANINFVDSTILTNEGPGTDTRIIDIHNDQYVSFSGGCTFETNGGDQNYRIQGSGFIVWNAVKVRNNVVSKTSVTSPGTGPTNGTALWIQCPVRFAQGTRINQEL